MKMGPRISEAEWEVMKVVWKRAPRLAQDIIQELAAGSHQWSPATVKTMLNRLVAKGALEFEPQGKRYLYSPAITETEGRAAQAESFLNRVFDGALSPMLSHFVQSRRLSPQDLAALEQVLRDKKPPRQ